MATVGPGSAQHLYGEYFKMMTGIDMVPVHYHGAAPALTDLIAGRVQVDVRRRRVVAVRTSSPASSARWR